MFSAILPRQGIRQRLVTGLMLLLSAAISMSSAHAQQNAEEGSTPISSNQADAILQELKEIRKLLESIDKKGAVAQAPKRAPVPQTAKVSIEGSASLGSVDAPVTVVEFTDYQCPYCLRFIQQTFPKLKETFIDKGKVRWIVKDLPLGFHKNARKAAQAAHCAGEQNKFWEMRDILFTNAKKLEAENLPKYAQVIGLDSAAFESCLASDRYLTLIDQSALDAGSVKITGTPTFVIGKVSKDSVEGQRLVGARHYDVFEKQILDLLKEE